MFEKYTENARRVIFFARYEASAFGSPLIDTEHLLLGLFREDKSIGRDYLGGRVTSAGVREAVERAFPAKVSTPTTVDLPLSNECKRILAYSAEESWRLNDDQIRPEHLLLGILREEDCYAARLLREYGLTLAEARTQTKKGHTDTPRNDRFPRVLIEGAEGIAELPNGHHLPNIGETIVLHRAGGTFKSYRVSDVTWEYDCASAVPKLNAIKLKVTRQNPPLSA
jgi:ATP-dependent Clp protease ATP-binding subunit ClpA